MIVFVIPFRSKVTTNSWTNVSANLVSTVTSLTNQSSGNFKAIIVGHEYPAAKLPEDSRIEFHRVEFPPPNDFSYHSLGNDRGRKIAIGCMIAGSYNPDYVMPLDADDRVGRQLVEFIEGEPARKCWIIDKGYVVHEKLLRYYYTDQYHKKTSSCILMDPGTTGIPLSDRIEDLRLCHWFRRGHNTIIQDMQSRGIQVYFVPFACGSYLVGRSDNISNLLRISLLKKVKFNLRYLIFGKKVNKEFLSEFGKFNARY